MSDAVHNIELMEALEKRMGKVDMRQIVIWRQMTPSQRLEIAFQAYQFALETVRLTEQVRTSGLTSEQFAWRVTRRMQGDQRLGKEYHGVSTTE